jgi:hypothetical protein
MKQLINKVTGLQVGFTTEWVVLDNGEWRTLTNDEMDLVDAEATVQEALKTIQEAKEAKLQALQQITVTTTSGKVFDGRDIDQQRMVSAIMSADVVGITETYWKLADNSVAMVTLDELKEALALSIQALGVIIMMEVVV